jgi:glucose-6-phosphate isomerase
MLTLDYSNMMAEAVAGGISESELRDAGLAFRSVWASVRQRHARGELGFLDLPTDQALFAQSRELADTIRRDGRYGDIVLLGIGGSALGPLALRTALRSPGWNMLPTDVRGGCPRLHILDNVDPISINGLLGRLPLDHTLFLVVSKSGGTAETMAQYLVVRGRLADAGIPLHRHFVFVTDPEHGALRRISRLDGIRALDIPPNVGGRFSVLSPVGILPAALMGIDVAALLEGAADMRERCETEQLLANPAGIYAALHWLADVRHGKRTHVFMPYSDPLRDFALWFVQLWAESLGKLRTDGWHVGPTPVAALGATDQHSQVQLFMEGPLDKIVTFVAVNELDGDITIPNVHPDMGDLGYLGGHRLGELLHIERRATAGALARRGRPNMTLTLERVDPWHVGGLIMLLELATAFAGELYGVNAYDQPGVELGKRFTYAMLGREGFDDAVQEWDALAPSNPARQI